jgi:hypothetical protein
MGPVAGVVADRRNRRLVMIAAQIVCAAADKDLLAANSLTSATWPVMLAINTWKRRLLARHSRRRASGGTAAKFLCVTWLQRRKHDP